MRYVEKIMKIETEEHPLASLNYKPFVGEVSQGNYQKHLVLTDKYGLIDPVNLEAVLQCKSTVEIIVDTAGWLYLTVCGDTELAWKAYTEYSQADTTANIENFVVNELGARCSVKELNYKPELGMTGMSRGVATKECVIITDGEYQILGKFDGYQVHNYIAHENASFVAVIDYKKGMFSRELELTVNVHGNKDNFENYIQGH